ncbi:hypothetical protein [Rhizobium pisi]|uniref:hypothetical protein n=1 Tax=Rhizobium pisi TaxID=574561 RepID=UPI003D03BE91
MSDVKNYFAVNAATRFVVGVFVGNPVVDGLEFVEQNAANRFVREGFKYTEGAFSDAREAYKPTEKFVGVGT